ncbi:UNVERIFIED_CONTAM: hypothetical protein K2H54_017181 [Gekko kuhli]
MPPPRLRKGLKPELTPENGGKSVRRPTMRQRPLGCKAATHSLFTWRRGGRTRTQPRDSKPPPSPGELILRQECPELSHGQPPPTRLSLWHLFQNSPMGGALEVHPQGTHRLGLRTTLECKAAGNS